MNTEMSGTTRYVPQRKPFDWASFAKKTGIVVATGGLFGVLGYGFYTTVKGQAMNNVRAMGYRVGAQFSIVAVGLAYYAVNEFGTPSEMYERYQTTGKIFSHPAHVQAQLVRHKPHPTPKDATL
jgi:hypothetical protein